MSPSQEAGGSPTLTFSQPPCDLDFQGRHSLCQDGAGAGQAIPTNAGSKPQAPEANTSSGRGRPEG